MWHTLLGLKFRNLQSLNIALSIGRQNLQLCVHCCCNVRFVAEILIHQGRGSCESTFLFKNLLAKMLVDLMASSHLPEEKPAMNGSITPTCSTITSRFTHSLATGETCKPIYVICLAMLLLCYAKGEPLFHSPFVWVPSQSKRRTEIRALEYSIQNFCRCYPRWASQPQS